MEKKKTWFLAAVLWCLTWSFSVNVALGEGAAGASVSGDAVVMETEQPSINAPDAGKTETGEGGEGKKNKEETKKAGEIEDERTSKKEEQSENEETVKSKENVRTQADMGQAPAVYRVSFPTDIKATLDPGNVSGSGQVFSERYKVENYGNTDVAIKIKNINVWYTSEEELYVFTDEEVKDNNSGVKKLHINMIWESENGGWVKEFPISEGAADECVLVLKAAQYDDAGNFVRIQEGGRGFFYYTGSMSADPKLSWKAGECTLQFDYELLDAEKEEDLVIRAINEESDGEKEKETETGSEATTEETQSREESKTGETSSEKESTAQEMSSEEETSSEEGSSGEETAVGEAGKEEG